MKTYISRVTLEDLCSLSEFLKSSENIYGNTHTAVVLTSATLCGGSSGTESAPIAFDIGLETREIKKTSTTGGKMRPFLDKALDCIKEYREEKRE